MNLHRFILTVKHDRGTVTIETMARDEAAARRAIMAAERCPERAIRRVRAVSPEGYELEMYRGKPRYRSIKVDPTWVRPSFSNNGQKRPDKVPLPWVVHIEDRWRRIYATRDTGARYVILDNLKVMLELQLEKLP